MDFDHQQTIGRIILTWLHAEQVGGDTSRARGKCVGGWGSRRDQYSPNCIHESWLVFMHWSIAHTSITTTNWKVASHFKSSPKKFKKQAQRSIFTILSGFSHCVWQRDCSDTAMQKGGCTWDPGNFITPSQAVSVQDPGLCAGCPALRTGSMAQTTLCVIATSHRALWYVHLPWLVLQIALMSLPPCLCSLASSHWSSPGCTTAQP